MKQQQYIQDFNPSEEAKKIGLVPGSRVESRMNVDGFFHANTSKLGCGYYHCRVTRAKMLEAKNGHTTLQIWCYKDELGEWYENNEVKEDWWIIHPDTLRLVMCELQKEI